MFVGFLFITLKVSALKMPLACYKKTSALTINYSFLCSYVRASLRGI